MFNLGKNKDDKNILAPLDISKNNLNKTIVDLLLYKNHCILIKKLHAYVVSNHDHKFVCRNCLSCYGSEDSLNQHRILCLDQKAIRYVPSKQKYIEWEKYPEKLPIYITIIADFECRNEPSENIDHNLTTKNLYQQKPICNGSFVINRFENKDYPIKQEYYKAPSGEDNKYFVDQIDKIETKMSKFFKTKASIKIEKMEIKDKCSLCQKDFGSEVQVQHYCKLSGNYLGNGH